MKIENLERAVAIQNELHRLNKMSDLLDNNRFPMICVYQNTSTGSDHEMTWDDIVTDGLKVVIDNRIEELEKEVKTL